MLDPILAALGDAVRQRRQTRGLTVRGLADRAGLSPRFVSQIEHGAGNVAVSRLAAIAEALACDAADLLPSARAGRAVALVGLRGAGKTTLGRRLAAADGVEFVETDERIEALAALPLGEIFSLHGEEYYRRLEALAVGLLIGEGRQRVLALSGGVVTNAPAWALLRARCHTVWLRAEPEQYMHRVLAQGDRRPVRDRGQPMDELRALLREREPLYSQAETTIDTAGLDIERALAALRAATGSVDDSRTD